MNKLINRVHLENANAKMLIQLVVLLHKGAKKKVTIILDSGKIIKKLSRTFFNVFLWILPLEY